MNSRVRLITVPYAIALPVPSITFGILLQKIHSIRNIITNFDISRKFMYFVVRLMLCSVWLEEHACFWIVLRIFGTNE